jgi:ABC-type transporter Mla subunit MlaD
LQISELTAQLQGLSANISPSQPQLSENSEALLQAVTTRVDLSSADAARNSEALSDLERRLQATEDGVKGVSLSVKGVEDSLRGELAKILER